MQTWQMRFSAEGRPTLFPEEALRRDAVRTVGRMCAGLVVLLSIVDDHLHLLLLCDRERVGRVAHDLLLALRPVAAPGLEPAWFKPVSGRNHLENLVEYLLTQVPHHGLPQHPALYTGNGFVDLVGARAVDGLQTRLTEALPRYRLRTAFEAVGLPATPLVPAGPGEIHAAGAVRLAEAAKAALCVGPELRGRTAPEVRARVAAATLARVADLRSRDLVEALGVSQRAVQLSAAKPAREEDLQAVRLRLALEDAVRRATGSGGG
jgi:hypothetical protein